MHSRLYTHPSRGNRLGSLGGFLASFLLFVTIFQYHPPPVWGWGEGKKIKKYPVVSFFLTVFYGGKFLKEKKNLKFRSTVPC